MALRLVIFDVDGTLVDSQAHIMSAMRAAFAALDLPPPAQSDVLSKVGLSLNVLMEQLVPGREDVAAELTAAYKQSFQATRAAGAADAASPLYPGVAKGIAELLRRDDLIMGVATGKSKRGLDHLMDLHGWGLGPTFQTVQTADFHPSKPHPSMVEACLSETGVEAKDAVMVGDTSFDIEMARSAGVAALGVGWGFHSDAALRAAGAVDVLQHFADLPTHLDRIWGHVE